MKNFACSILVSGLLFQFLSPRAHAQGPPSFEPGLFRLVYDADSIDGRLTTLTNHPSFPDSPTSISVITNFATVVSGDTYGQKIYGYLKVPLTGDYDFYIASDDQSALYLSSDDDPAGKVLIAREPAWNNARDWLGTTRRTTNAPENRSLTLFPNGVPLETSREYYIEALHAEGSGGDHFSMLMAPHGTTVTNGQPALAAVNGGFVNLCVFTGPVAIRRQTQNRSVTEGWPATFSVLVDGTPPFGYQWKSNGLDVAGATGPTYTTVPLGLAADGARFSVVVSNQFHAVTSEDAQVMILPDQDPPVLLSAGSGDGQTIGLCFDETVTAASADTPANYSVSAVDGGLVTVNSATLRADGRSVVLNVAGLSNRNFTVTANNIRDSSVAGNVGGGTVSGRVMGLLSQDIGGPAPPGSVFVCGNGEIEIEAGGSALWGSADQIHFFYMAVSNDFDVRVQVASLEAVNVHTKAGLMVRETIAANSRHLYAIVKASGPAQDGTGMAANLYEPAARLTAGGPTEAWSSQYPSPVPYPNAWIRMTRATDLFRAYWGSDGVNWTQFAESTQSFPRPVLVGLPTVSGHNGTAATALYRNFQITEILADTDADGMPDSWEEMHGLSVGRNDAAEDPDGDGRTNLEEYLSGTDARDPASVLRLQVGFAAGTVRLEFTAAAEIVYRLEHRPAVEQGAWNLLKAVLDEPFARRIIVDDSLAPASRAGFYRLVVP